MLQDWVSRVWVSWEWGSHSFKWQNFLLSIYLIFQNFHTFTLSHFLVFTLLATLYDFLIGKGYSTAVCGKSNRSFICTFIFFNFSFSLSLFQLSCTYNFRIGEGNSTAECGDTDRCFTHSFFNTFTFLFVFFTFTYLLFINMNVETLMDLLYFHCFTLLLFICQFHFFTYDLQIEAGNSTAVCTME